MISKSKVNNNNTFYCVKDGDFKLNPEYEKNERAKNITHISPIFEYGDGVYFTNNEEVILKYIDTKATNLFNKELNKYKDIKKEELEKSDKPFEQIVEELSEINLMENIDGKTKEDIILYLHIYSLKNDIINNKDYCEKFIDDYNYEKEVIHCLSEYRFNKYYIPKRFLTYGRIIGKEWDEHFKKGTVSTLDITKFKNVVRSMTDEDKEKIQLVIHKKDFENKDFKEFFDIDISFSLGKSMKEVVRRIKNDFR